MTRWLQPGTFRSKLSTKRDPLANVILRISAFLDGKLIQKDLFYDADLHSMWQQKVDTFELGN